MLVDRLLDLYAWVFRSREAIPDCDRLYRAVHSNWVKPDGTISSGAFDGINMSVDLASKTTKERVWRRFRKRTAGLALVTVRLARDLKQDVRHSPEPFRYSHTLVLGRKTQATRKRFARNAIWVIRAN
jgi:hypothetical protein